MNATLPRQGRLAGIDFGTRRVGVAISDAGQVLASPHENYTRKDQAADAAHFQQLVEQEEICGFVVGLPVHASGEESQKSREARRFGRWLAEVTGRPVAFYDERYSTAAADHLLDQADLSARGRKQRRDMLAAQIILAGFLESVARDGAEPGNP